MLVGEAIAGFGITVAVVVFSTIVQRRSPKHLIARVSVAAETLTSGPQRLSIAVGATLVSLLDYRFLLVTVVVGMMFSVGYLWAGRELTGTAGNGNRRSEQLVV